MNLFKKHSVISFGIFLVCAGSIMIISKLVGATETLDGCLTKIRVGV